MSSSTAQNDRAVISPPQDAAAPPLNDANRLGLDYRSEATAFRDGRFPDGIFDVHTHVYNGPTTATFFEAMRLYGIEKVWSMSPLEDVDVLRDRYGDHIEFIAVPNFKIAKEAPDRFNSDFIKRLEGFAARGCRMAKFWAVPRGLDFHPSFRLDDPGRIETMKIARSLGMILMTHVSDPDTWFQTKYLDTAKYGTKADQYVPLERLLEEFGDVPWMAAHLAGNPEHLDQLAGLLERHPNLHLDCSATKWMVRELSKHPGKFAEFCRTHRGRILFGSDIVVGEKDDPATAFDLYASRYWALRTLLQTSYNGPSPIVDPDLSMVDPALPKESTAHLRGANVDDESLEEIYRGTAKRLLEPRYAAARTRLKLFSDSGTTVA